MLPVLACNSPPGWVPCLCQTLDINNLWPSQQAVLIGPPCFLMRKLRGGPHTTVQWGCWSSKPEQANCRSLSLPTTLLWLSQHFLGFEFYFQTETLNMRPCATCFHSRCHWKLPNEPVIQRPYEMKPDFVVVPSCPECTQATKLPMTQLSRKAPLARNTIPSVCTFPSPCAQGHTAPK